MSRFCIIVLLCFFTPTNVLAQGNCPTNFDGNSLDSASIRIGEIVSCIVMIDEVQKAYLDKPYYRAKLLNGGTIWLASLIDVDYKKEDILCVMGYMGKLDKDDKMTKYNKDGYHILVMGIVDQQGRLVGLPDAKEQLKEWNEGNIPQAVKD